MPARLAIVAVALLAAALAGPALADGASAGLRLGGSVGPNVSVTLEGGLVELADGGLAVDLVGRSNSREGYEVQLVDRSGRVVYRSARRDAHPRQSLRAVMARPAPGAEPVTLVIRSN